MEKLNGTRIQRRTRGLRAKEGAKVIVNGCSCELCPPWVGNVRVDLLYVGLT